MNETSILYDDNQKYAVHFGSGNIGRGFIGKILSESGYRVIFIDIQEKVINALHKNTTYMVEIAHPSELESYISNEEVCNVDGILNTPENTQEINHAIYRAEIITTAVGPNVLPLIAPTIAKGLEHRYLNSNTASLNIIACENMTGASVSLEKHVHTHINSNKIPDNALAFPCCSVDRIVVPTKSNPNDILLVRVEEYNAWYIDKNTFIGNTLLDDKYFTDNLEAYVERKLFTLNTGHCILAYLGYIANYQTIAETIADSKLKFIAYDAMKESGAMLQDKWGFSEKEQEEYIQTILTRFTNELLEDQVTRVGRDPLRKLGNTDRFITPLLECKKRNLKHDSLIIGISVALLFDAEDDPNTVSLQNLINTKGISFVLRDHCEIQDEELIHQISKSYHEIKQTNIVTPVL